MASAHDNVENSGLLNTPARKGRSPERERKVDLAAPAFGKGPTEEQTSSADEADDSTCAICLKHMPFAEIAQPVGCDHVYCTCCILHWANFKEKPWCPQCKLPFSSILTFRTLDGGYMEQPCQESVTLLKCSQWFKEYVQMKEQTAAAVTRAAWRPEGSVIDESDYVDYARYYQEYDDDEEVEDYYYSSAAGRARIVIGNRRHGPNGYLSSGRMQARPSRPNPPSQAAPSKGGKGSRETPQKHAASKAGPMRGQSSSKPTPAGGAKKKKPSIKVDTDDESDEDCGPSKKPQSMGRRARRNQKKAAADAKVA